MQPLHNAWCCKKGGGATTLLSSLAYRDLLGVTFLRSSMSVTLFSWLARHSCHPLVTQECTAFACCTRQVDVTFPYMPCAWISLDVMDISGDLHLDVVSVEETVYCSAANRDREGGLCHGDQRGHALGCGEHAREDRRQLMTAQQPIQEERVMLSGDSGSLHKDVAGTLSLGKGARRQAQGGRHKAHCVT